MVYKKIKSIEKFSKKKYLQKMKKSSLLIIESNLIPEHVKIFYPIIKKELKKRKIGMKIFRLPTKG